MSSIVRVKSIKLPNTLLARAANKSAAHRALVTYALKHNLEPALLTPDEEDSFPLNLVGDLEAKLAHVSHERGIPLPVLFGALAKAALRATERKAKTEARIAKEVTDELSGALLTGQLDSPRAPQKVFWDHVSKALYHDKIVLAEASTGVGKGRVIVSAAVLSIRQGKGPVVIAAPTIKVLSQLWSEFEKEAVQSVAHDICAAILPGQQEFVDDMALRDYLTDEPDPAVQAWIDAGGKGQVFGALARSALRSGQPLAWLMEDLRAVATNLRAEDFALSSHSNPNGEAAQQMAALRASVADAQIIFCTHAMLAISVLTRWNSLPPLRSRSEEEDKQRRPVFLIDEAHQFETALSNATSDSLSLYSLRHKLSAYRREHNLGTKSTAGHAAKIVNSLTEACAEFREDDRVDLGDTATDNTRARDRILPLLTELDAMMAKRKGFPAIKGLEETRTAIHSLINALSGKSRNRSYLTFSPDRRFPSLQTGAASVSPELERLWAKATGGAALISASFYVPDNSGRLNCDHMRTTLALPLIRMDTPLPVVWDEIYRAPTLHIPSRETSASLVPPAQQDHLPIWCEAQAAHILRIADAARGGTLVLCTAYSQVHFLQKALEMAGMLGERLIIHQGNIAVGQKAFFDAVRRGNRPVWLALGPAWTGLDLRADESVNPEDDMLLTDLVITRIPIGLNRSNTQLSRMDRIGFRPVAQEAMLTFKQGIGRLIRREGLTHRHLWILDGRLQHTPTRFMAELATGIFSMLTKYKRRSLF